MWVGCVFPFFLPKELLRYGYLGGVVNSLPQYAKSNKKITPCTHAQYTTAKYDTKEKSDRTPYRTLITKTAIYLEGWERG